ncbi:MAG: DJ-1/PfpI family protein [Candidatus Marsarchaeota archaeon]|jgi:putative intracellular protease/amidase|nr:DJ-1/PfpI family protein [Candidatus Marsarchaeota archaeon]
MVFLVFIAPKNFTDETLSNIKLFFNKWGIDYKIASYSKGDCEGAHGAVYKQDVNANKVYVMDYEGIVLVDGKGIDEYKLYEYRPLLDLLSQFNNLKKVICAVGNASTILARANIIQNKKIAVPKNEEIIRLILLFHGIPSQNNIEFSDNIITINSKKVGEYIYEMLKHINKI